MDKNLWEFVYIKRCIPLLSSHRFPASPLRNSQSLGFVRQSPVSSTHCTFWSIQIFGREQLIAFVSARRCLPSTCRSPWLWRVWTVNIVRKFSINNSFCLNRKLNTYTYRLRFDRFAPGIRPIPFWDAQVSPAFARVADFWSCRSTSTACCNHARPCSILQSYGIQLNLIIFGRKWQKKEQNEFRANLHHCPLLQLLVGSSRNVECKVPIGQFIFLILQFHTQKPQMIRSRCAGGKKKMI